MRQDSRRVLGVVLATAFAIACRTSDSSADRVNPVPRQLPYLGVKLPPSTRNYHASEEGLQHSSLQLRFDLPSSDLPLLAKALPCKLGPVDHGEPQFAVVGTNEFSWYTPEKVAVHRGCSYHRDIRTASFLVDVERADWVTVFASIASE
jgi:hypothetical protein